MVLSEDSLQGGGLGQGCITNASQGGVRVQAAAGYGAARVRSAIVQRPQGGWSSSGCRDRRALPWTSPCVPEMLPAVDGSEGSEEKKHGRSGLLYGIPPWHQSSLAPLSTHAPSGAAHDAQERDGGEAAGRRWEDVEVKLKAGGGVSGGSDGRDGSLLIVDERFLVDSLEADLQWSHPLPLLTSTAPSATYSLACSVQEEATGTHVVGAPVYLETEACLMSCDDTPHMTTLAFVLQVSVATCEAPCTSSEMACRRCLM